MKKGCLIAALGLAGLFVQLIVFTIIVGLFIPDTRKGADSRKSSKPTLETAKAEREGDGGPEPKKAELPEDAAKVSPPESTKPERKAREPEKLAAERKPAQTPYTIISDKPTGTAKRSVEVLLKEKASKEALESIAKEIRASKPKKFERTFILYYLPGQPRGAGAWATSHFNPTLEVDILGIPQGTDAPAANAVKEGEQEIGRWEHQAPPGFIAILVKSDTGILLRRVFGDGSSMDARVSASSKGDDIILSPIQKNGSGDYWILDSAGDFRLMDKDGFIDKATVIGKRKEVEQLRADLGINVERSKDEPTPTVATIFDSRTWTSADGQRTFSGKLIELGDGQVTVEKDGETITFPVTTLSEADRRFLGQGVTITTVDGKTHENGSVARISADAILFKKESGPVSIPMESLPESLRSHFGYGPKKAAEARKAREQQAATERPSTTHTPLQPRKARERQAATGSTGIRKDAERLYLQLREMRHNPEFHHQGFKEGSPFRQWYIELEALKKKAPIDPELLKLDLVVGELYTLATEWRENQGRDTEVSRFFSTRWDRACGISPN